MTRAPQPTRRNRSALSDIAVRLALLALVSYPVFPASDVSPVGTTRFDLVAPGTTPGSMAVPARTATSDSCLTITATPGTPVVTLAVTDEQCGGDAETGGVDDLGHASFRSGLGHAHPCGVGRPGRSDVARHQTGVASHRPGVVWDRTDALWWERGRPSLR